MIRLFVAITIPDDIRMLICGMGGSLPGARPVPMEQLHLTIKFIGDINENRLLDIKEALAAITSVPFMTSLKGVGHFPPRGTPRVIWVGIDPVFEVINLRNKVEKVLADIGIPREKRKFSPHVTVARLKNSPLKHVTRFLAGNSLLETPTFQVDHFQLYSSQLTSKGAIHTLEAEFELHR